MKNTKMEPNALLIRLIEHSPSSMWISDDKGTLLRLNQACRDLFHIQDEEVVGKYNVFRDEILEAQGLLPIVKKVFEDGKTARFCFEYDTSRLKGLDLKEKVSLVLDVTVIPIFNGRGKVTHALVHHTDITASRHAEELLRESENRYRTIFETTGMATIIVEEDMTISLANAELEKLTGYSRAEVEGKKKWTEFVAKEDLEKMKGYHYARRNDPGSAPRSYEFRLLDRQGNVKNVLLTVAVIAGTKKSVASILDISERKRVEHVLRRSEETARRLAMESEVVAEIGRIISSNVNIDDVYELFAQEAKKIIRFDRIAVNTFNLEEKTYSIPFVSGIEVPGYRKGDTYPLRDELLEAAKKVRPGGLFQVSAGNEAKGEEELKKRYPSFLPHYRAGLRSIMAIPLVSKNQLVGSLNFQSLAFEAYSKNDLRVGEKIANQIAGAVAHAKQYQKEQRMKMELHKSEERYRLLVDLSPLMIITHQQGKFLYLNSAAIKALGASSAMELVGKSIYEVVHPDYWGAVQERINQIEQGKEVPPIEEKYIRLDKKVIDVEVNHAQILDQDERIILVMARDITEQKKAEREKELLQEQLQQAQKMEAIGTLAGGIAHDFNNILAGIMGYAELASLDVPEGSKAQQNLQNSIKAAHRAKNLVQQILAFSRQGKQERRPLDIRPIVKESLKFLRASLPATIEIRQELEKDSGVIEADPTQIHQVLMNLCTNAAQAMDKEGGVLELSLENVDIKGGISTSLAGIEPGPYLRLRVSDTGRGIPPEILPKIYNPYFTTKEVGKGTGLGLAVVNGVVKSYGGGISVSSEVGKGTTFEVYFPRIKAPISTVEAVKGEALPLGGNERVLFVDDEQGIVEIGQKALEHLGYKVVVRTSSLEALELFRAKKDEFDLVITDMTMPNMRGDKLAQELLKIRPEIPVILCTGFSEQITEEKAKEMGIREFVLKPLVMKDLAKTIRRALDSEKKEIGNG